MPRVKGLKGHSKGTQKSNVSNSKIANNKKNVLKPFYICLVGRYFVFLTLCKDDMSPSSLSLGLTILTLII